jgi:BirA family biotin operon repressor/biotin-[acetyl-CoA-carboxylase] ligase
MNRGAAFVDGSRLRADTLVRHVEVYDELDSTNDRAGQFACDPAVATPALIVARHQTAGRGRGRNVWWADDGALTFSLLLQPAAMGISTANWPQVSLATAVAVCDALQSRIADCGLRIDSDNPESRLGIKWPNDVLVNSAKICGILIESPGGAAPAKDRLIIGVGINVNNSWSTAPLGAGTCGTALCDVTGRQHDLEELLVGLLRALHERLAQLAAGDEQLRQAWQRLDLLAGREVSVETDGRSTDGTCVEIAADGALVVDTPAGLRRLYSGTVTTVGQRAARGRSAG